MGTRSFIGIENEDKTITFVYCHFYSYRNLEILTTHYNREDKIRELLSYGGMSMLSNTIKDTVFYRRDYKRIEENCYQSYKVDEQGFLNHVEVSFNFLFKDGVWYYRKGNESLKKAGE